MKDGKIVLNGSTLDTVTLSGVTPCGYDGSTLNISFCCMGESASTGGNFQAANYLSGVHLPSSGPFYLLKVNKFI